MRRGLQQTFFGNELALEPCRGSGEFDEIDEVGEALIRGGGQVETDCARPESLKRNSSLPPMPVVSQGIHDDLEGRGVLMPGRVIDEIA